MPINGELLTWDVLSKEHLSHRLESLGQTPKKKKSKLIKSLSLHIISRLKKPNIRTH